jgi:hypothetical protein
MAKMLKDLPLSPPDNQSIASIEYDFYSDVQFDFSVGAEPVTSDHQKESQVGVVPSEFPEVAQLEQNW